jgi:hypothetical protein
MCVQWFPSVADRNRTSLKPSLSLIGLLIDDDHRALEENGAEEES